jgi:hypothetical protein
MISEDALRRMSREERAALSVAIGIIGGSSAWSTAACT